MYDVICAAVKKIKELAVIQQYSVTVYPTHISTIGEPADIAVSLCADDGGVNSYHTGENGVIFLDIWVKQNESLTLPPYDMAAAIYKPIKEALNLKPLPGRICRLKQIHYKDGLFEPDTQRWHTATQYQVITAY